MPQLNDGYYIHKTKAQNKNIYKTGEKLLDIISLASAPSISKSTSISKKIDRKLSYEKRITPKRFTPGSNHKYLLKFSKDGVLDFVDVENRIAQLPKVKQIRELAMKIGMLKKLYENGYLELIEDKKYKLSELANDFIEGKKNPPQKDEIKEDSNCPKVHKDLDTRMPDADIAKDAQIKNRQIKITKFDIDNIIKVSKNKVFTKEILLASPKKVRKNAKTLA